MTVPCGFTETGLPIGLQLVAPPNAETALLRAVHAYEQSTPWHAMQPDRSLSAGRSGYTRPRIDQSDSVS